MSLVIENAQLDGRMVSLLVEKGKISALREAGSPETKGWKKKADGMLDAGKKYLVPSLKNGHTHAAMTLLRGFADDMKLQPWLSEKIWPAEAHLTPEHIYWGTRLAALEMIKSGTTFFNDMYFHFPESWQAIRDSGVKAASGPAMFDFFDEKTRAKVQRETEALFQEYAGRDEKILFSLAPHSIYTVSKEALQWVADFAGQNELVVHIHLSETEKEVQECIDAHGMRPVEYLDEIGFLGPNVIAAHAIWLEERELDLLARHQTTVVHNPVSNMKLVSGNCFPFADLKKRGVPMMLGTDGASSNNNLDMFDEMKIAALLQKHHFGNTELMSAGEIFSIAHGGATDIYPHLSPRIEAGAHADFLLIDPEHVQMVPNHHLVSNLVYSAGGDVVDTAICGGEVLMQNREVGEEDTVLREARRCAEELVKSAQADGS